MSNKPKSPVGRLLRRNISAAQLAAYALANFAGLAIVLCAIQFYRDVNSAFDSASDSFINRDFRNILARHPHRRPGGIHARGRGRP